MTPNVPSTEVGSMSAVIKVERRLRNRITSYNVCYTKLLRRCAYPIKVKLATECKSLTHYTKGRITSYNVCYTKLLRRLMMF